MTKEERKVYYKAWLRSHPLYFRKYSEMNKVYSALWRKKHPNYWKEYLELNPDEVEKNKVRQKTAYARRKGLLVKKPCMKCGDQKSEAHHTNYKSYQNVKWLCKKCHEEHHHKLFVKSLKK